MDIRQHIGGNTMTTGMDADEVKKLLDEISRQLFRTGMISADDLCYGSEASFSKSNKEFNAVVKIMNAVPKRLVDAYNAALRKAEADKLRAKADDIERGVKA
jgi:cell division septum initiation protein DivIVA